MVYSLLINWQQHWAGDLQLGRVVPHGGRCFSSFTLFFVGDTDVVNVFFFPEFKNMQQKMHTPKNKCSLEIGNCLWICLWIGLVSDSIVDETTFGTCLVPL